MKNLKYTKIHGKGFDKTIDRNISSNRLDFKTLPSIEQWRYFQDPRFRVKQNLRIALSRNSWASSFLLMSIGLFYKIKLKALHTNCIRVKYRFIKWWAMESWIVLHDQSIVWWRFHCTGNDVQDLITTVLSHSKAPYRPR